MVVHATAAVAATRRRIEQRSQDARALRTDPAGRRRHRRRDRGRRHGGDDDDRRRARTRHHRGGHQQHLPLTFQEAKAQGNEGDIDWGDQLRHRDGSGEGPGRNAPPCVEPLDTRHDNGGATSQGVTADEILVALYKGQPDPLQQAIVEGAGADTDPNAVNQTSIDYLKMFEDVAETYGRTLKIETIEATGGPADATAAQADAQKVIDMKAFAARRRPGADPAWCQELVTAKIICIVRALAQPQTSIEKSAPYLWPTGSTPEQADEHFAELVGKQLVGQEGRVRGRPATCRTRTACSAGCRPRPRPTSTRPATTPSTRSSKDKYNGKVVARSTYLYDPNNAAEHREHGDRAHEGSGRHDGDHQHRPADPGRRSRRKRRSRTTSRSG